MAQTPSIPLNDPSQWPVRMTRAEVAFVLRISERTLRERIAARRFPPADDGRSWPRDEVSRYALGRIREFERHAAATQRRRPLSAHRTVVDEPMSLVHGGRR